MLESMEDCYFGLLLINIWIMDSAPRGGKIGEFGRMVAYFGNSCVVGGTVIPTNMT